MLWSHWPPSPRPTERWRCSDRIQRYLANSFKQNCADMPSTGDRIGGVLVGLLLLGVGPGCKAQSTPAVTPAPRRAVAGADSSLRALASARGRLFGSVLERANLDRVGDSLYRVFAGSQFSVVTAPCKIGNIRPTPSEFRFGGCDRVVEFAREHHMVVRGHTLFYWKRNVPGWMEALPDTALWRVLRQYVDSTVRRYRGKVQYWDVANELVDPDDRPGRGGVPLQDTTFWLRRLGPSSIDSVFVWAHKADPSALLFYNERGIESGERWVEAIIEMVTSLKRRGIPIDGVGLQFHLWPATTFRKAQLLEALNQIASLGLEIHV